jgi:Icc-related predicted phosphoesterase
LRIFVAADIHGSDVCWKKFLNAGKFYGVDALVLAGDLTGKALVPVIAEGPDRYRVKVMGRQRVVSKLELEEVERLIRFNGFYPYRCEPDEVASMREDEGAVTSAFQSAMRDQLERWIALAEERLTGTGVRAFVMPGNDDEAFVSMMLDEAPILENQDGRAIDIGGYSIVGQGWSNSTPWDTPREKSEDDLERELMELLDGVTNSRRVILNPHVPPHDTGLDSAPELDDQLQVVARSGQPNFVPVGSTGVRRVVESTQPLVSLSGHIHESKGVVDLAGTTCVNPGSEYNLGRLLGAIVELRDEEVRQVQLVTG